MLDFFELWNVWDGIGAALLIVAAIMDLGRQLIHVAHFDVIFGLFLGLGTFFECVNLLRYFQLSRSMSVLVNTLRLSFFRVMSFVVSVLPVIFFFFFFFFF